MVFLINSGPLAINYIAENVPAILEGFYLGQETGVAAADVLFGDYNPAGKLPVSFPRSVGQLPIYYNHKPSARRGYLYGARNRSSPSAMASATRPSTTRTSRWRRRRSGRQGRPR